eukprot:NODE_720_length_4814_cov_0.354613.p3 type:complete len:279 gc:universal NODE_720_length_4814_cov_0.354613:1819-2655(+)
MLLLASIYSSVWKQCYSTNIPTSCSKILTANCYMESYLSESNEGDIERIKVASTKFCTPECAKKYKESDDCMSSIPEAESIAKQCKYIWNANCGSVDSEVCVVPKLSYWQSKGYTNLTVVRSDVKNGTNPGYQCTKCQKQQAVYHVKYEEFYNSFFTNSSEKSNVSSLTYDLVKSTCGNNFFDNFTIDTNTFSGYNAENQTESSSAGSSDSRGLSTVSIVLLSVLIPLGFLSIVALAYYFMKKGSRKAPAPYNSTSSQQLKHVESRNMGEYYVSTPSS